MATAMVVIARPGFARETAKSRGEDDSAEWRPEFRGAAKADHSSRNFWRALEDSGTPIKGN